MCFDIVEINCCINLLGLKKGDVVENGKFLRLFYDLVVL